MATPQKGPNFGPKTRNRFVTYDLAATICDTLKAAFGNDRHAVKTLARISGASTETAKNWLSGRNPPGLGHFIILAQQIPELRSLARRLLALESDLDPEMEHELMRLQQQLARILAERRAE